MKQTLRASKVTDQQGLSKRVCSLCLKRNPIKHHKGDRKRSRDVIFENERECYEGLSAANESSLILPSHIPSDTVCNIIMRDIWQRSRSPDDVLKGYMNLWG